MASLNFPPTTPGVPGNTYTENGVVYYWDGEKWTANNEDGFTDIFVDVSGDTMTGQLTLPGGGSGAEAIQVQEVDQLITDIGIGDYVSKTDTASQNIESDLTLGTDKITLDATDGTAMFDGDALINDVTVGRGAGDVETNTAVGQAALVSNTTGLNNTAIGRNALQNNTSGLNNTGLGKDALQNNTEGNFNTAVGRYALVSNTTGENNTAVGQAALYTNTEGESNIAIGTNVLYDNTTGDNNTAVGYDSLRYNTEGSDNTAVGRGSLFTNTTGANNTAVGQNALSSNTEGDNNIAVGVGALNSNTEGTSNTTVGNNAGLSVQGDLNTIVGHNAGFFIEGSNNTILGAYQGGSADASLNDTVIISAGRTERMRIDENGDTTFKGNIVSISHPVSSDRAGAGIFGSSGQIIARAPGSTVVFGVYNVGFSNRTVEIRADGSALFDGSITADNVTFNVEPDNDANYTTTTEEYEEQEELTPYVPAVPATYDEYGVELTAEVPAVEATYQTVTKTRDVRTYTGPTLDVKAVIQELQQRVNDRDAVIADLTTRIQTLEGGNN